MNSLIDISVPLGPELPLWPGSTGMKLEKTYSFEKGDDVNVSMLTCDVHTGTHIEASLHFNPDGESVARIPIERLIGDAYVAYLSDADMISSGDLDLLEIPSGTERLLLRTENSKLWEDSKGVFRDNYAALSQDAAEWIVNRGIKLVGIDYLSIEIYKNESSTAHKTLLSGGVTILESLNLSKVQPGIYELICLPLKLEGAEASPARAFLRVKNEVGGAMK